MWAGIKNLVRCHRLSDVEKNDATANRVFYKFIQYAETHRDEIDGNLFSDERLEAVLQTITRNEFVSENRRSRRAPLVQLDTQEYGGGSEAVRSGAVGVNEASRLSSWDTPEEAMIAREIEDEVRLSLRSQMTENQRYILDQYWDFDGDGSARKGKELAEELGISMATFNREVKRIKKIVRPICVDARRKRGPRRT